QIEYQGQRLRGLLIMSNKSWSRLPPGKPNDCLRNGGIWSGTLLFVISLGHTVRILLRPPTPQHTHTHTHTHTQTHTHTHSHTHTHTHMHTHTHTHSAGLENSTVKEPLTYGLVAK